MTELNSAVGEMGPVSQRDIPIVSAWLRRLLPVDRGGGFPGRWLGGLSLILGPIFLLTGALLRVGYNFFFPDQLVAFDDNPALITAAYDTFILGNIILFPGVVLVACRIARVSPGWALWGGLLTMTGLFTRTFYAGVDYLAAELVTVQGVEQATKAVGDSYGHQHMFLTLTAAAFFSWIVLALACYRTGTLGLTRSIALGLMAALPIGVLKGTRIGSLVAVAGVCIAFMPIGWDALREGPRPTAPAVVRWSALVAAIIGLMFLIGTLG